MTIQERAAVAALSTSLQLRVLHANRALAAIDLASFVAKFEPPADWAPAQVDEFDHLVAEFERANRALTGRMVRRAGRRGRG